MAVYKQNEKELLYDDEMEGPVIHQRALEFENALPRTTSETPTLYIGDWENLPEMILVQIFSFLTAVDKYQVGLVCSKWAEACARPGVWTRFRFPEAVPGERTFPLSRLIGNYLYTSNQTRDPGLLDMPMRPWISLFNEVIQKFGKFFKNVFVEFKSSESSQIMNSIAEYCMHIEVLTIRRLDVGVSLFQSHGNFGKEALHTILQRNCNLQHCEIRGIDRCTLITDRKEPFPLGLAHSTTLKCLYFYQSFHNTNMSNLMYLVNLQELAIEPNILSYSLLHHLASHSLQDLRIVALARRTEYYNEALQNWHWKSILAKGSNFRVHCHFGAGQDWTEKEIMLKESMPVKSMRYTKFQLLNYIALSPLICKYSATLEEFIDYSVSHNSYELAKTGTTSSICTISQHVFNIVRECENLRRLAVKEVLPSTAVLAMLYLNNDLDILLMEKQLLYGQHPLLDDCFPYDVAQLITESGGSEEAFVSAVFSITGRQWKFVPEDELFDTVLARYPPHFL